MFRGFSARLNGLLKGGGSGDDQTKNDAERIDPARSPRPRSHLGVGPSSEPTPPTSRKQKSDSKKNNSWIPFQIVLTCLICVQEAVRRQEFHPLPAAAACKTFELCCRSDRFIREQVGLEVELICFNGNCDQRSEGVVRCLHSSQVCGWMSLHHFQLLRCTISLFYQIIYPAHF